MTQGSVLRDPRRARWDRLVVLLDQLERRGARRLQPADARELVRLYRTVSSDLLEERRRDEDSALAEVLGALVVRAHGLLDRGAPLRLGETLLRFFATDFPAAVQRRAAALLVIAGLWVVGAAFGALAYSADPGAGEVLLPFGHREMDAAERVAAEERAMSPGSVPGRALAGAALGGWLFEHNTKVTFLAFALAVTGGVGTALLTFFNGALLGAVVAKYVAAGQTVFLVAWLAPHGVLEIPAIGLGGAAGLVLARALFLPGLAGRRASMASAGPDALRLVAGAAATLLVAGAVEGTLSQMHAPALYPWKVAFAVLVGAAYALYLFVPRGALGRLRGRRPSQVPA